MRVPAMRVLPGLVATAMMLAAAPVRTQPAGQSAVKKTVVPEPLPRRGFNVVLLLGGMTDAGASDTVPTAARKALADMKDFLPYKGYGLLDTQWVLSSSTGPAITRLRGVDEQEYELELRASVVVEDGRYSRTGMSVRFLLREAADAVSSDGRSSSNTKDTGKMDMATFEMNREIYQLERERDEISTNLERARSDVDVGLRSPEEVKVLNVRLSAVNRRMADLKQTLAGASSKAGGRAVIDTSFRMEEGETVVVGTSKVKGGGRALIALLTATADRAKSSSK